MMPNLSQFRRPTS